VPICCYLILKFNDVNFYHDATEQHYSQKFGYTTQNRQTQFNQYPILALVFM
jgi:hypothetical protein